MTRFIHDQFCKDYLEQLLSPYGQVEVEKSVMSEVQEIDLWFEPNATSFPIELGLLGRFARTPSLFEPYRDPVSIEEINDCLLKLLVIRGKSIREAKRQKRRLSEVVLPRLWILTPTASVATIESFGGRLSLEWGEGIYFLPPSLRAAIVVLHQLPATTETLWLRLLGRGKVQQRAIEQVNALPSNDPLREIALELLYNLRWNLEINQLRNEEDRELIMRLAPLYQEDRQKAIQEGIEQGIERGRLQTSRESLIDVLQTRFEDIPVEAIENINQIEEIDRLRILFRQALTIASLADFQNLLS